MREMVAQLQPHVMFLARCKIYSWTMVRREQQRLFDWTHCYLTHKKWMHPLAIFRVHAIASIYFPDFLDILPCLIQSQVGQILSRKISYHKLTQFSKKKNMCITKWPSFVETFILTQFLKNIFNLFPNHLYNSGRRLALLKSLKLCGAEGSCL